MDGPPLASLSLTHVHYNPDDPVSYLCAYLSLAPQALMIIYVALIWSTREVEVLLMFTGQMGCEALNWILKRTIREERPAEMLGKGYGMPSSHAQFVAFFSTSFTLFLLLRHQPHALNHPSASHTHIPTPFWQRLALSLLSIICAAAVAQSRIYLSYHTPKQVYAGVTAGVACAIGWYIVTEMARRTGVVDTLLELPLARWLRLRDLVVTEDPIDAGWERWELRRQKRNSQRNGAGKKNR